MALMFENLFDILMIERCVTFYGIRCKRSTKSTHFFVIAFNRLYTSDNIAIGPDVCFPEARDTHIAADFHSEMCLRLVKFSETNPRLSFYHL